MWDLPEYRKMRGRTADDIKHSCSYLDPSDVNAMTRAMTEHIADHLRDGVV